MMQINNVKWCRAAALKVVMVLLAVSRLVAGPLEFGMAEFNRAVAARGLKPISLQTAVVPGPAESYNVQPGRVTGADQRGLMYGLLEAADQIRRTGRIAPAQGKPRTAMRGIRTFLHNADLERGWYYSREYWSEFFAMLARNRFNRFNLVFAHQTNYLAPPYPFWLELPEFPSIRARGLSAAQRGQNLEMLRYISETAAAHGIDFTLGLWEHNIQAYRNPPMEATVDGLTRENIGPYSYAALKKLLQLCPAIRSIQLRTNAESGIPEEDQPAFYRDWIFRAVREAGTNVMLDLRGWTMHPDLFVAARNAGVPLRMSTKYWAEDMGRPYQPAETFPRYSYMNFLEKPRTYDFYWEIWALGTHRLLLWGDPEYVRRTVSTFGLGGGIGFEIDAPLAQKGFGNRPGKWGILAASQKDRVFWKYEFERYWAFYQLWGRLSYDPSTPDAVWSAELNRRFGAGAEDVARAYGNASNVITEIVAAHLADPNMYIWPEVNPGGLLPAYKDVLPSDWRYVAGVSEAVKNRLEKTASAKQTPIETAALLDRLAAQTEQALARAAKKVSAGNAEWRSTEPDFQVLAALARYHARKQKAAYDLEWFEQTGNLDSLAAARTELKAALDIWTRLVRLTDGLYPDQMAYGPADVGHWKDKLPYVQHDVVWVEELERTFQKFGQYQYRFDFGGPLSEPSEVPYRTYRDGPFIRHNTIEPRFALVHPETKYSEATGYGWVGDGQRSARALPLTPYAEAAAVASGPKQLPRNVLFGDFIEGTGAQVFRIRTGDGSFEVRLLKPDGSDTRRTLTAAGGLLDVAFPEGPWQISGVVIRNTASANPSAASDNPPKPLARPKIVHVAPKTAPAGQGLKLAVTAAPAANVVKIRLHYRALNALEKFRTLEAAGASATFTIPVEHISGRWDVLYYFEVLNSERTGWFEPDPSVATPYYVVAIDKR